VTKEQQNAPGAILQDHEGTFSPAKQRYGSRTSEGESGEQEREREREREREKERASERRRQKGDQRGAGIATERPLRNEQPVERASAGCWLLLAAAAAADYDGVARLYVVDEARTR